MTDRKTETPSEDVAGLAAAVANLYFAGYWHCDRAVDEKKLWTTVRDAAGIKAGQTGRRLGPDRTLQSQSSRDLAVAEAVRDAAAKVCDDHAKDNGFGFYEENAFKCADKILALDLTALIAGMKEKK